MLQINATGKKNLERVIDLVSDQKTDLPTIPIVIDNFIKTAKSEKTSAKDLADFIINDPAISIRVLRLANSAYYGMSKKIDTISRAIVLIGFNEILSLILGMSVFSTLSKYRENSLIDMTKLWKHSVGVGFAARKIAQRKKINPNESTILAGLLHDIGKIIFSVYFPDEYNKVLKKAANGESSLYNIEKQILGLNHAEMAYLLMEYWNFPGYMRQPIRYHHDQSRCLPTEITMAYMIGLADLVCHKSGIGQSGNCKIEDDHQVLTGLRLPYGVVDTMANELRSEQAQIDSFLTTLE